MDGSQDCSNCSAKLITAIKKARFGEPGMQQHCAENLINRLDLLRRKNGGLDSEEVVKRIVRSKVAAPFKHSTEPDGLRRFQLPQAGQPGLPIVGISDFPIAIEIADPLMI